MILVYISDVNSRSDRPLEIDFLANQCTHNVIIKKTTILGLAFRIIDKFKLEKYSLTNKLLKLLGFYSFPSPASQLLFDSSKPTVVRSYFQRFDFVNAVWETIAEEITAAITQSRVDWNFDLTECTVVHVRRGDTLSLKDTYGLLSVAYFNQNSVAGQRTVISTDDSNLPNEYRTKLKPTSVISPKDASAWEAFTLMVDGKAFVGSNSTLSWWASYIRSKAGASDTFLPHPWTKKVLGFEEALRIPDIQYNEALFVNDELS